MINHYELTSHKKKKMLKANSRSIQKIMRLVGKELCFKSWFKIANKFIILQYVRKTSSAYNMYYIYDGKSSEKNNDQNCQIYFYQKYWKV